MGKKWGKDRLDFIRERALKITDKPNAIRTLFINRVRPWKDQPRKRFNRKSLRNLAESIQEVDQKVPIMVCPDPDKPGHYIIIDGERRWRACKLIERKKIQAIIMPLESGDERLIRSVIANFGREGHGPYETALVLKHIVGTGKYTTKQVAAMFAKSDAWVYQHLSLTKLGQKVVELADPDRPFKKRLKFAIAILLTSLPEELQYDIAKEVTDKELGIKAARYLVEVRAAEKGLKAGGLTSRPERRKKSLLSLLTATADSMPSFLNIPGTDVKSFITGFSEFELARIAELSERCIEGLRTISEVTATVRGVPVNRKDSTKKRREA